MDNKVLDMDYMALNAMVDLYAYDENGKKRIQIEKDAQATRQYFLQHVDKNTHYFPLGLEYKIDFLLVNGYYDPEFLKPYGYTHCTPDDPSRDEVMAQNKDAIRTLKKLYDRAYKKKFRFESFIGAYKFYTSYALKTFDSTSENVTYLERWEDRVVAVAMYLAKGDVAFAEHLIDEIISGKFQPATPTFQNAGKLAGGHLVSCFLLSVPDSLEGWMRGIADGGQLSKLGGGVGYCLTDIRPAGDPLKGMVGLSKGVLPYMKILEDLFSAVDQLGQRPGAAAAYLHANHMDIMDFLDTKRENADEKVRIKTLSLGIVMPDIVFELAKNNEDMYTFSSHDVLKEYGVELSRLGVTKHYREMVENPRIRKGKVNARRFLQTIAELQFESGYPYVVFEDTVNRANAIDGYINMSNLCSEILQVSTPSKMNPDLSFTEVGRDISCNLGSLNIAKALDGKNLVGTVETAIRALSAVSDMSSIDAVPSVKNGNSKSHAIGLGQMNLHGFFAREGIQYGDEVSLDFTNIYFYTVAYHAIRTSNLIATERGETFFEFEKSKYASGEYFEKYTKNVGDKWTPKTEKVRELFKRFHVEIPSVDDWENLRALVMEHGIYNAYLQAVPPTGSISYINNSTASIHPITAPNGIEKRIEGKLGKVISPAPFLSEETLPFYRKTAYDLMDETLQVYGQAAQHVDQGQSLTLFTTDTSSTRDMMKVLMRAWKLGNKTVYYTRTAASALAGTADEGCVSCAL